MVRSGANMVRMGNDRTPITDALAAQLRAERAASGLTLDEMVESTGMSKSSIQRYLKGGRIVDIEDLALFARAFGVSMTTILDRAQERM